MPRFWFYVLAALLSLGILVTGCAPAAQQVPGVQVDKGGNQVTVKGNDGTSLTVDSTIPDELKNFPVPQGFTSQGGGTMSSGGEKLAAVSWKGSGQAQSVIDFYKSTLPGQGWKEDSTFVTGDGGMLNYSKPDGYGLTVTVSKEEGNKLTIAVLGGKASKTPTPRVQATAEPEDEEEATPTPRKSGPEPTETPKAPTTGSVSALPAELKDQPLPAGFAPIKDRSIRMASGGKFQMASADFFGKMSVKEATDFYSSTLPAKGWNVDIEQAGESESTFVASSKTEEGLTLAINISEEEAGTKIYMQVTKS